MRDFLRSVPPEKATNIIGSFPMETKRETIVLDNALGRVLAENIRASESIPPYSRSLVDGFAVKAKETYGAKEAHPVLLTCIGEIRIGKLSPITVTAGTCVAVSTGSMVPEGADAIVMQEYTRKNGTAIEITKPLRESENIISRGEDIRKGSHVLSGGKRLTSFDIAVLAALGIPKIEVYGKIKVAIISSGDELVPVESDMYEGNIRDINRYTISGLVSRTGAEPIFIGITEDTIDAISSALTEASPYDMTLISGGSSKGERDYITSSLERLGGSLLFHGINVRPGKPAIFAGLNGKPFFGLPGHPLSCMMVTVRFVSPLLRRMQGESVMREKVTYARLRTSIPSTIGIEEYYSVSLRYSGMSCTAMPIFVKSSAISALTAADGYIIVPQGKEGLEKDELVEVRFFD